MDKKYRLYVDETGDHSHSDEVNSEKRYLGLSGVLIDMEHYCNVAHPQLEKIKQDYFRYNPDEPIHLHRKDIVERKGRFRILMDPLVQNNFDSALLAYLNMIDFKLITAVIDKTAHRARYGESAVHPYHICLSSILERYADFLRTAACKGDVMAETRGGVEDRELKIAYKQLYERGRFTRPDAYRAVLASSEIKLKNKEANVTGLQIADLIAHPSKQSILVEKGERCNLSPFAESICSILNQKYLKNENGVFGKIYIG